jgi:hypothetical protein
VANRLRKVKVDEISLVPRPANQLSDVLLHKNDPTPDQVHTPVPLGDRRKKKRRFTGAEGDKVMPQIDKSALDPELAEYIDTLEKSVIDLQDEIGKSDEEETDTGVESLLKSADPALVEYVQSIEKSAAEAQEVAKAERDARITREFLAKGEDLSAVGTPEEVASVLKSAAEHMPEDDYEALEGLLKSAHGKIESGDLFAELGKSARGSGSGSESIEKAASALMADDASLTKEQAVDAALAKNPDLYSAYLEEEGGR